MPVAYFDFSVEDDLILCWNFTNIRVARIELNKTNGNRIDILAARPYFEALYTKTGFSLCLKMIEKISKIEFSSIISEPAIEDFIIKNGEQLQIASSLNKEEFNQLNKGMSLKDILLEREIIKKFG